MVGLSGFGGGIAGGATVAITIKAIDNFSNEFKQATTGMQKFARIAEMAIIAAATAMAAFTASAVQAALKMKPIADGFSKLAKGSDKFLDELDTATKGTISDFDLMSNANKALLLGLDQDALPDLFKNAAIVGRAAGRTTAEAIQDITLGIGRQSRLILDNLGIILKAGDVYEEFAASIGKSASELTAQEKQFAFNAAAMEALQESASNLGGVIEDDVVTQIQQMSSAMSNFKTEFGTAFIGVVGPTIGKTSTEFEKFGKTMGRVFGTVVSALLIGFSVFNMGLQGLLGLGADFIRISIKPIEFIINGVINGINLVIEGINRLRKVLGFSQISLLQNVDITSGLEDFSLKRLESANSIFENINRMSDEVAKSWKDIEDIQTDSTAKVEVQLTDQEKLVQQLQGFKVLYQRNAQTGEKTFGDIFNPRSFQSAEFESRDAFNQAQSGGGITINIENINGLDPEEISRALSQELNSKISL